MQHTKLYLAVCIIVLFFFLTGCASRSDKCNMAAIKTKIAEQDSQIAALKERVSQIESAMKPQIRHTLKNVDVTPPLLNAAYRGEPDKVKQLISEGADVRTKGPDGMTALHLAAMGGHQTTAEVLLNSGADIKALDDNGRTAADLALINGHEGTAKFLREKSF